jgi:hypothetical protein
MESVQAETGQNGGMIMRPGMIEVVAAPKFIYGMECLDEYGDLKWAEVFENLVTTVGKNDLLDKYFKGSTYTAAWFVSLIDADTGWSAVAAGDTMASHGGWQEAATTNPTYSNGTRPALTLGTPAAGSVDNVASVAAFTINATNSIKGAFVTTVNTKDGTTGILYSAGAFAADRAVISGDTLNVTITLTV